MKFKIKIIQKSKLKTVILVLLLTLSMASFINIDANFSKANQEVEPLNSSAEESMPITPKYEYAYENDFDYSTHYTQITSHFWGQDAQILGEELIGANTEWSQNPTDTDNLDLSYFGGLNPGAGLFDMNGIMVIESHNTFEKHLNPNLGVYIDWSIDLDIMSDGIDLGSIRSHISLSIYKSAIIEELVKIENLNLQDGTFYLANFDQYIGDDGKIKFALRGDIDGTTLWYEDESWIYASIEIEGLRVVQEIRPQNYKYAYENDFDYSTHYSQITSQYWNQYTQIIAEDIIGENMEWSQNPTDADNLQFSYIGSLSSIAGSFYMNGIMLVESHKTFEKQFASLGVYIDWSIDFDIIFKNVGIQSSISLSIYKSNDFQEPVMIGDLNQKEGTFYLANFSQYIWNDGKIRLALRGDITGITLLPALATWIYASIEIKGLRVVQEIQPQKYNENDFDYSTHYTQLTSLSLSHIIEEDLIGENTEWSQNPTDADNLTLSYVGGFSPWAGLFYMDGVMVVESHNTFEHLLYPSSGAYIDWSIDFDIISSEGINLGLIQSQISLGIYKSNDFEELVMIGDLNQLEGIFYLANFNQYIWNDGKIRLELRGLIGGILLNAEVSWIYASIKIKGLQVVQESEKRTLILVHGFATQKTFANTWFTYLTSLEFKKAYDKIIVISYLGDYVAYKFSKNEYGVWQPDPTYDLDVLDTSILTSIDEIATGLALYIMQDLYYIGDNVDIICHSMGGLVTRNMIKRYYAAIQILYTSLGRNFKIHTVCTIATPNHGVWYGWLSALTLLFLPLPLPTQPAQMAAESPFLTELNDIGVYPGTEIPESGISINWFTYRSGLFKDAGVRHDKIVEMSSVPLSGATNKGIYNLYHGDLITSKMMNHVVFNDIFKPPELIQTIFNEATPGKIIEIEDLTLEEGTLRISLPPEIAIDIDSTSVFIEINSKYQMHLVEGTTDTYEVELPLAAGDYSFLITANDLDGRLYQISGNLKILPDVTSPIITIITPIDGSITNQDVTLTYTVSDDFSDISDIIIIGDVSGTVYSSEGSYDIIITATDEAGNSASETVSFIIDKTAPDINFNDPPAGYYNTEKIVLWEVTDDYPDVVSASHPSGTIFDDEGIHTVTVTATDLAGNSASRSLTIVIDKTAPVITIEGPAAGYYNTDQTVTWSVLDDNLDPDQVIASHPPDYTFSTDGTYQVTVSATDLAGNTATASSAQFVIDKSIPMTSVIYGFQHFIIDNRVHLTSTTPIELKPGELQDITFYRIFNDTYDSGVLLFIDLFYLNLPGLYDGIYELEYYSTDIAGNEEEHNYETIVLDNSPPTLSWEFAGDALQDGILFEIEAGDATGVDDTSIVVSIRELNGPIVVDDIPGQYLEGLWQADGVFDTTTLPDGYYELVVDASDAFGFPTTEVFSFSIRNWAVLVLLPSTESNKAGRTMPIKFALRVAYAVDPNMPFVVNQELDIFVTDTITGKILQHSTYGSGSRSYRINELSEHYITNFKTHKKPTIYLVSIYRKDFFIGDFYFATVK